MCAFYQVLKVPNRRACESNISFSPIRAALFAHIADAFQGVTFIHHRHTMTFFRWKLPRLKIIQISFHVWDLLLVLQDSLGKLALRPMVVFLWVSPLTVAVLLGVPSLAFTTPSPCIWDRWITNRVLFNDRHIIRLQTVKQTHLPVDAHLWLLSH